MMSLCACVENVRVCLCGTDGSARWCVNGCTASLFEHSPTGTHHLLHHSQHHSPPPPLLLFPLQQLQHRQQLTVSEPLRARAYVGGGEYQTEHTLPLAKESSTVPRIWLDELIALDHKLSMPVSAPPFVWLTVRTHTG
jgi:hypothetical protein